MNRLEICRRAADKDKVPVALVMGILDAMIDDVIRVWSESGAVTWPRFCTWYVRQRKARLVRHQIKRKRAAKPGEPADQFQSLVPAEKTLVFVPSIYFRASVATRRSLLERIPKTTYQGAGAAWRDRIAARVGRSGVEIESTIDDLFGEIIKQVTRGVEVRLDGFGLFYSRKRGGRYYVVNKKGGGRQRVWVQAATMPAYRRA